MKKVETKKGFTLIELLAVIVILGIIMLIAFPIIKGVLENSKEGAFKVSVNGIVKSAEYNYSKKMLENQVTEDMVYTYNNGVETTSPGATELDYKGAKPTDGIVRITPDGKVALALFNGTWCAVKTYDSDEVTMHKRECTEDDMEEGVETPIVIEEITPKANVWVTGDEDTNEGYITIVPETDNETYDLETTFSTTLEGTSINYITHEDETYYLVSNEAQFNAVRHALDGKFLQVNDITISSDLSPIGATVGEEYASVPFTGYYNGRGFELKIESMDTAYVGSYWALFPKTKGAELIGMNVIYPNGVYAGSPNHRGGLVAYATDTIIRQSSVRIPEGAQGLTGWSQQSLGGLVGTADNTIITDCYFIGDLDIQVYTIDAGGYVGGLVGQAINHSLVERTYAVAKLDNDYNNYTIHDYMGTSEASPDVMYIGGIIGLKDSTSIIRESYYNSTTQALTHQGHGIGKTTDFLKNIGNFTQFGLYEG